MVPPIATGMFAVSEQYKHIRKPVVDSLQYFTNSTDQSEFYNAKVAKKDFSKPDFSNNTDISDIINKLGGGTGTGWSTPKPQKPKPGQDQDTNLLYNTTLADMLYQ